MKIEHITVSNYQRLTHVDLPVRAPLLLIAGPNEQGKTSLADAIYHVCASTARRASLKKDYPSLVHDGQKNGIVALTIAGQGGEESTDLAVKIPADKRSGDMELSPLLQYLLDAKRFPRLPNEERRKLLFGITGTRISGKTILEKLLAKGANKDKATEIGAVLLAGFDAAADEATKKAAEARGSWKATTGEQYGSVKAADWTATKPKYDAADIEKLEAGIPAAEKKVSELTAKKATLDERRRAVVDREEQKRALQLRADGLERAQEKLKTDQADVDEWTERVRVTLAAAEGKPPSEPLACPHCSGLVDLKDGKLLMYTPPAKVSDAKAKALLGVHQDALSKVTRFRDNDQLSVTDAQQAVATLAEYATKPLEPVDIGEIQRVEAELATASQHLKALRESLQSQTKKRDEAAAADERTTKAKGYHTDVAEWSQIAEWLAPSGIQSEMLTEALGPFNQRLAATHGITGWDKVTIDPDMTIRIGGRPFSLGSASAQWRAEAALTEAIAWVSKVRTFLLDEVEVLVGDNRMTFLKWMHTLAANGNIDTAILIGSFLEKPTCPPTFQVEWLTGGVLAHESVEQQEAA